MRSCPPTISERYKASDIEWSIKATGNINTDLVSDAVTFPWSILLATRRVNILLAKTVRSTGLRKSHTVAAFAVAVEIAVETVAVALAVDIAAVAVGTAPVGSFRCQRTDFETLDS